MKSETLFLGVDGGGTKCKARLESAEGQLLGEGLSGSANPVQGVEHACNSIVDAALQAIKAAGLKPESISNIIAGLGLAGVTLPSYKQIMSNWKHPFDKTIVTSDMHIACISAHNGEDGAVMITGTGSNAGTNLHGNFREFSGYGFVLADKGSGARLGLEAIRLTLEQLDGLRQDCHFTQSVIEKIACSSALEIVEKTLDWIPRDYAQYAPLVFELALKGDRTALGLVESAADHINLIARHLLAENPARFSMIGGIAEPVRPWLADDVQSRLEPPLQPPEVGAIILARQSAGQSL